MNTKKNPKPYHYHYDGVLVNPLFTGKPILANLTATPLTSVQDFDVFSTIKTNSKRVMVTRIEHYDFFKILIDGIKKINLNYDVMYLNLSMPSHGPLPNNILGENIFIAVNPYIEVLKSLENKLNVLSLSLNFMRHNTDCFDNSVHAELWTDRDNQDSFNSLCKLMEDHNIRKI